MKRFLAAAMVLLCACSHAASAPVSSPSAPLAHAIVNGRLARLVRSQPAYAAVLAYDRQIAALRDARFPAHHVDGGSAGAYAERAASIVVHVRQLAASDETTAMAALNPASLSDSIEKRFERQVSAVRMQATSSSSTFLSALRDEQHDAVSNLARALELRAERAFTNRAQELREREANDQLTRDRNVANRRLILSLKLQDLRPDNSTRQALRNEIAGIDRSLREALAAEQARDGASLAQYRVTLRARAIAAFDAGSSTLRHDVEQNWMQRQRVAQAEGSAVTSLRLPKARNEFPRDEATRATDTIHALRTAGSDISRQLGADVREDRADRADAAREIAALTNERDALVQAIALSVCDRYRLDCGSSRTSSSTR